MPVFPPVEPVGFDPSIPNEARVYDYGSAGRTTSPQIAMPQRRRC